MEIVGWLLVSLIAIVIVLVAIVGGFLMKIASFGVLGRLIAVAIAIATTFIITFLVVLACLVISLMMYIS